MSRTVAILVWAELKRIRGDVSYWLKLVGYDPTTNVFYRIYVLIFWLFWLATAWGYLVQQVYGFSTALTSDAIANVLRFAPGIVLSLQSMFIASLLREPPLKLSTPEMSYAAAAPIHRGAIALTQYLRRLALPALVLGLVSCLLSMLLSWRAAGAEVGFVGIKTMLVTWALVYATGGLGWILALPTLRPMSRLRRLLVWPVFILIVVAAALVPQVGQAGGALWVAAVQNVVSPVMVIALIAALALIVFGVVLVGDRAHMSIVADNSLVFARIQRLGLFGRFYASDVIARVQRQAKLIRKRRLRLMLKPSATGYGTLWSRYGLGMLRLAPSSVARPLTRGFTTGLLVVMLVSFGGWQALPVWLLVVILLIVNRPLELAAPFRDSMNLPFMRQFLPHDPLVAFSISAFYPILYASAGCIAAMVLFGWWNPLVLLLVVFSVIALALAQGLESVEGRAMFGRTIPYPYAVGFYAIAVVVAGLLFHSPPMALMAAGFVNLVLALFLKAG